MKKTTTYFNLIAVATAMLLVMVACTKEHVIEAQSGDGQPALHLAFGGSGESSVEATRAQMAEPEVQIFPNAVVTTYDLRTEERVVSKYDGAGNLQAVTRSGVDPNSPRLRVPNAEADGATPDERYFNRIEVFYFAEKDNECFFKQVYVPDNNKGDLKASGFDLKIPAEVTEKQYSNAKFARVRALVIVNHNTGIGGSTSTPITEVGSNIGKTFVTLVNLSAADMVSSTTNNYPSDEVTAWGPNTANHFMILVGEVGSIDLTHFHPGGTGGDVGSYDGTYNVKLRRMSAKIVLDLCNKDGQDRAQYDVRIVNIPPTARLFDSTISGAQATTDYTPDELINSPWSSATTFKEAYNPVVFANGPISLYLYTNENIQTTLDESTRTKLLIRRKTLATGVVTYFKAYICPVGADANKDGHIRRNYIYRVKVDGLDVAEGGSNTEETAKEIHTINSMWDAGQNLTNEQPASKLTTVEYYEKFYINQGYYVVDLYYNGIVQNDPNTLPRLEITNGTDFDLYGQVQDVGSTTSLDNYKEFMPLSGDSFTVDNTLGEKVKTGLRFRVDMAAGTMAGGSYSHPDAMVEQDYNNPPRWNKVVGQEDGDYNHTSTYLNMWIGPRAVKSARIEFERKDVYHTVQIGDQVWMEHNLGAFIPPYLCYSGQSMGYIYQWGNKLPGGRAKRIQDGSYPITGITTKDNIHRGGSIKTTPANNLSEIKPYVFYAVGVYSWWYKNNAAANRALWQDEATYQTQNPCPAGFSVPTVADFNKLFKTESNPWRAGGGSDCWGTYKTKLPYNGLTYKYYQVDGERIVSQANGTSPFASGINTNRDILFISDGKNNLVFPNSGYGDVVLGHMATGAHYWTRDLDAAGNPASLLFWRNSIVLPNVEANSCTPLGCTIRCVKK
ncbi:MAG: hypothetical protein RR278_06500 [Mucinivorans sp.]